MAYAPVRGDALLIPSGPPHDPDRRHLFVVATDACADADHLLIGISTIRPGIYHDPACVLAAGSHPFITAPSYVEYRYARRDSARHIGNCVDRGLFVLREPLEAGALRLICDGVEVTAHISRGLRSYYRRVCS